MSDDIYYPRRPINRTRVAEIGWALSKDDGKMVSIAEVQRGLAANVVCPSCARTMIAKKGDVISWHFAHEASEHDCVTAPETAIHRAAKDVIAGMTAMNLDEAHQGKERAYPFEWIGSEVRVRRWKIDSMIRNRSGDIAVEFHVTHPCDAQKINDFIEHGEGLLEISLGRYGFEDRAGLARAIAHNAPRRWLSFPGVYR